MVELESHGEFFGLGLGGPIALVTSHWQDKDNVLALGYHNCVAFNPLTMMVSIAKSRLSHSMILESREYVLVYPDFSMWERVNHCGYVSGRNEDKIKLFNTAPAVHVKALLLTEAVCCVECKVEKVIDVGSHDMFIGTVMTIHHNREKSQLFHFGGSDYRKV